MYVSNKCGCSTDGKDYSHAVYCEINPKGWLGGVEYNLKYDLWCWGHYHSNRVYPRADLHDKLMLFNDCVFDVNKYFDAYCPQNLYDCLIKVHQNTTIDDMNKLFE